MKSKALNESATVTKYRELSAKTVEIDGLIQVNTREIVALEQSGAVPKAPTVSDSYLDVDRELLNGAVYKALPPAAETLSNDIVLYHKIRRAEQLKNTRAVAEEHLRAASIDYSHELLIQHEPEIRSLHRERALLLLKLFKINGDLEELRKKLLKGGGLVVHPLDGWSLRFFGQSHPPTPLNAWPDRKSVV